MGRQIKRVPLDFSWPLHKPWSGYVYPEFEGRHDCLSCESSGYSPEALQFKREWYGSLYPEVDFDPASTGSTPFEPTHPAIQSIAQRNVGRSSSRLFKLECKRLSYLFNSSWSHHLSQEDVDALVAEKRLVHTGLPEPLTASDVNAWSLSGLGHDSINSWVCIKARCACLGVSDKCSLCKGSGELWDSEEQRLEAESWEQTDPPTGEGWQLWETVSEGSPISPVFASPEELAEYLSENDDTSLSIDQWLGWITKSGWAPSGIGVVGMGMYSGVEFIANQIEQEKEN